MSIPSASTTAGCSLRALSPPSRSSPGVNVADYLRSFGVVPAVVVAPFLDQCDTSISTVTDRMLSQQCEEMQQTKKAQERAHVDDCADRGDYSGNSVGQTPSLRAATPLQEVTHTASALPSPGSHPSRAWKKAPQTTGCEVSPSSSAASINAQRGGGSNGPGSGLLAAARPGRLTIRQRVGGPLMGPLIIRMGLPFAGKRGNGTLRPRLEHESAESTSTTTATSDDEHGTSRREASEASTYDVLRCGGNDQRNTNVESPPASEGERVEARDQANTKRDSSYDPSSGVAAHGEQQPSPSLTSHIDIGSSSGESGNNLLQPLIDNSSFTGSADCGGMYGVGGKSGNRVGIKKKIRVAPLDGGNNPALDETSRSGGNEVDDRVKDVVGEQARTVERVSTNAADAGVQCELVGEENRRNTAKARGAGGRSIMGKCGCTLM